MKPLEGKKLSKPTICLMTHLGSAVLSRHFSSLPGRTFSWNHVWCCGGRASSYKTLAFRSLGEEAGSRMEIAFYKPPNNQLFVSPPFFPTRRISLNNWRRFPMGSRPMVTSRS